MIVPDRRISWFRLPFELRGSIIPRIRGRLLVVFAVAVVVTSVHAMSVQHPTDLTTIPFTLIGFALGVFLGFRTNTAYDRYWEGRRLWGRMVNDARSFARMAITLIAADATREARLDASGVQALQKELVYRMIGYVHALRLHLRGELLALTEEVGPFLPPDELGALRQQRNVPNALLVRISERIAHARRLGVLRHRDVHLFEALTHDVTDLQGGCERIKTTPMPWSYTLLIHSIVAAYCFALPFGLVATTKLLTPVVVVLIAYAFLGLDAVGDEIEDPFGTDYNDLPLTTLSRTIEVNLRQTLGEADVPPLLEPDAQRLLL